MEVKVVAHYHDEDGLWSYDAALSTEHESCRGTKPVLVIRGEGYRPGDWLELVELKPEKVISPERLHLSPHPAEDAGEARRIIRAWREQRSLPEPRA